jgi:hypothetical protein
MVKDSLVYSPHVSLHLGYQWPGGDMADRFGPNMSAGAGFNVKTRTNFYYGITGTYFFGNRVLEPGLLQNLLTDNGEILDNQGLPAIVSTQERGYYVTANFGKLFPVVGPNRNSGILVYNGIGFMQHKIRLEHQETTIPQLQDEYLKGYDRLTNGWALSQFLGYFHMSNNHLVNFYAGIEATEGFTQGRRTINYDTGTTDNQPRTDLLVGFRAGWVLHLYRRDASDYFYFD